MSMTDVRAPETQSKQEEDGPEKAGASRRHSVSPTKTIKTKSMARALSYDALESETVNEEEVSSRRNESTKGSRKMSTGNKY